jgi:hypothetical protein
MMISPFDPEWYPNIDWLIDTPGEWLQYMKNSCRPVWVLFGEFNQQKSTAAIEALAEISGQRGYNEQDNPGGDVQFVYSNIRKQIVNEEGDEFGAPSTASWASVRSTPTHVLYVAGMEYKRLWGIVDAQSVSDICDEIVQVMDLFRQNADNLDPCNGEPPPAPPAPPAPWSGTKSQAYGGAPLFNEDLPL